MFDTAPADSPSPPSALGLPPVPPSAPEPLGAVLAQLLATVQTLPTTDDPQAGLDAIGLLETVKAAAAAAQAAQTASYRSARLAQPRSEGVSDPAVRRGVTAEVAQARRCSPAGAQRYVGWAAILTTELPHTYAALRAGATTEYRAMLMARETAWLSREHRAAVDAELGPRLAGLGDRAVEAAARKAAYHRDPEGMLARLRNAENERRVSLRPAPDGMTHLSALLPVKQGVAVLAALSQAAASATATGDPRGRGQLMADTLVERILGSGCPDDIPVLINLVMPADTFTRTGAEPDAPGWVDHYGPVPGPVARTMATPPSGTPAWIRRLYADPAGRLVTMETRRRFYTDAQREFIQLRDQTCSTPYCDAPIRHIDHITPHAEGGPTSLGNAQGLCQACNYAKEHTRYAAAPPLRC